MMNFRHPLFLLLGALTVFTCAQATPIGPVYPPPGGVTFGGSGLAGDVGGRTNNYTALDTSAYDDLYWGLWSSSSVMATLDGNWVTLNYGSHDATTAKFGGFGFWQDADPFGGPPGTGSSHFAFLEFRMTLFSGATFVDAGSLGLDPGLGAVAHITGSSFVVKLEFLADYGNGWQALNSVPQLPENDGKTKSSFSGGFYYTESTAVPDTTSTLALVGLALAGLVALRRGKSVA